MITEKCLNHSLGRIEATYNQGNLLDQRREALQKWADRQNLPLHPHANVARIA